MNRRRFLRASGGAAGVGAAGTLGLYVYGARASASSDIVLKPGERGFVSVTWDGATAIGYEALPDTDDVEVDVGAAEPSPSPDFTLTSYPPSYSWNARTAVELTLPVSAKPDATPGTYRVRTWAAGPANRALQALVAVPTEWLGRQYIVDHPTHTNTVTVTSG